MLVDNKRYRDAANYAVYTKKTYEARNIFGKDDDHNEEKFDAFELLLLADAKEDFDIYCRYVDYRQPISRNFYIDRRNYLKEINDAVTNMYFPKDGKESYDVLRIKLPTRTGKSEAFNRAAFWVQGNFPQGETLYCVGGGSLKDSIHAKREAFIDEYWERHTNVFPDSQVFKMNKKSSSVWFSNKEYADIATVTVGGSIEGYVQCTELLVLDDLVASNEINSVSRLNDIYENDILSAITRRIVGEPKIILIGTPIATQTGVKDPLDRYYEYKERGGSNCKEFIIPALNENEESNIVYRKFENESKFKYIDTTEDLLKEKKTAYAGGNEVEIITFEVTRMMNPADFGDRRFAKVRTFTEVPDSLYRDVNVYDPADTGEDSAVMVHARIYDSEPKNIYIHDIFKDKRPLDRERNKGHIDDLIRFIIKNNIKSYQCENNLGGSVLISTLEEAAIDHNYDVVIEDYKQTKNKKQRIRDSASKVIESVLFRDIPESKSYKEAMEELRSWTETYKHDDVIDCVTRIVETEHEATQGVNQIYVPNSFLF